MEDIILEEVYKLVDCLQNNSNNKPGNFSLEDMISRKSTSLSRVAKNTTSSSSINQALSVAVVNSLWSILTGEKLPYEDKQVSTDR